MKRVGIGDSKVHARGSLAVTCCDLAASFVKLRDTAVACARSVINVYCTVLRLRVQICASRRALAGNPSRYADGDSISCARDIWQAQFCERSTRLRATEPVASKTDDSSRRRVASAVCCRTLARYSARPLPPCDFHETQRERAVHAE